MEKNDIILIYAFMQQQCIWDIFMVKPQESYYVRKN